MAPEQSEENRTEKRARAAYLVLRLGAALAFLYPPLNALADPNSWLGYFPTFLQQWLASAGIEQILLLHAFGVVEVIIGLWILSGWKIYWPCLAATAMLLAIVGFNLPQFSILFRDLSIAALTFALALMNAHKKV
ncbi:DoxX family membrane protein [Acetobacteraceae bacterium]|nr:DoxX family membrane protein [Candidatus Parcubacteria bacterium]